MNVIKAENPERYGIYTTKHLFLLQVEEDNTVTITRTKRGPLNSARYSIPCKVLLSDKPKKELLAEFETFERAINFYAIAYTSKL